MASAHDTPTPWQLTSSRLDRSRSTTSELASLEEAFSTQTIHYCERAFDGSTFFRALAAGAVDEPLMRHAFLQYRFFRDQLHRWFGLCIMKAPGCRDPHHKAAIMALADHIFTDLRDSHEAMYDAFLDELCVTSSAVSLEQPSEATRRYIGSFFQDFELATQNFFVALAALGGRELCVSLRNRRLIRHYFIPRRVEPPTWIALHAAVELDHFRDAIRPVLVATRNDAAAFAAAKSATERTIDHHVQLFDELLREHSIQGPDRDESGGLGEHHEIGHIRGRRTW